MYTKKDLECWIDGAYGQSHAYAKMAALVRELDETLAQDLDNLAEDEDDLEIGTELLDQATALLNSYCQEGLTFWWDAGDLILGMDEE